MEKQRIRKKNKITDKTKVKWMLKDKKSFTWRIKSFVKENKK